MSIVGTLPNNIQDGQAVDAVPVMGNYNWIVNQVNANAAPLASPVFTGLATIPSIIGPTSLSGSLTLGSGGISLDADKIHADAITCLQQLGINLPQDSDYGLFVRIGAERRVLSTVPLWVPKESLAGSLWGWYMSQTVVKLSTAHIRRAVA